MEIEIKHMITNEIIISGEYESIKDCLQKNRNIDLSYVDLSDANLCYVDLHCANLSYANLRGADLSCANLSYVNFCGANLSWVDFCFADLRYVNFCGAELHGTNLSCASLLGAEYRGEKLNKEPVQLLGLKYFVMITKEQIKIGCEEHRVGEWEKFEDSQIIKMYGESSLVWWKKHKKIIMDMSKLYKEE